MASLQEKLEAVVTEHNTLAAEVEEKRQRLLMLLGEAQAYQKLIAEEAAENGMSAEATDIVRESLKKPDPDPEGLRES